MSTSSTRENKCPVLTHDFEFVKKEYGAICGWCYETYRFKCKKCGYETLMPHLYKPFYVSYIDYINTTQLNETKHTN